MIPHFTLNTHTPRILIPYGIKLLALGAILYIGVLLNFYFLDYKLNPHLHLMSISIILILIALELILFHKKNYKKFHFFHDKVQHKNKTLPLKNISKMSIIRNFFDTLLGTCSILFTPNFKMHHVKDKKQIHDQIKLYIMRSK